ncbi:MAG: peptidoglycan DD-metalloendopeptidase family protein [Nitriliruptorales bacterium]|nr:peptidoglycan DD-metalloendopeptidase family protein [Nitriliruptorales bacterium]
MRVLRCARPTGPFLVCLGWAVAAFVLASPVLPAQASETSLQAAQQERAALQQRLDEILARLDRLQTETAQVEERVADLQSAAKGYQRTARKADQLMIARVRDAYMRGQVPAALTLFSTGEPTRAAERTRLLALIALRHRSDAEQATSAQTRAAATAEQVSTAVTELDARRAELAQARADAQDALEAAQAREEQIRRTIAAAEAARERAARQRAARQQVAAASAAPTSSATSGGGAPVRGGIACPMGTPRSYSDTYGDPRSGGRSHRGTDIIAPHGTPIYAYEDGTIQRMNSSSLGGISLYLRGSSGNLYFYTHLSGYAGGASVGRHVTAGTHIAFNGDTGNAAGIPHLHFEVMPGGGYNVNPYPYVYRACG